MSSTVELPNAAGPASPAAVYGASLHAARAGRAHGYVVRYADGDSSPLDLARWCGPLAAGDGSLLDRCVGPTLDIGCGPGRLAAALRRRAVFALGIDVNPVALALARSAGAQALQRSVFDRVPLAGSWATLLLVDGNLGIGGDPRALLARAGELATPTGHVLVELDRADRSGRHRVRLEAADGTVSRWFGWAHVGPADLPALAKATGLTVAESWSCAGRDFAALRRRGRSRTGG